MGVRIPLSWVRDFTPLDAPTDEIVSALNQLGLEVDSVEHPGRDITGVRVARILEIHAHPNADRLQLADVDYGDGTTRVVCGATNIHADMVVPFAPAGATLPGGFTLERRKIRGETSDGMLCSVKELGLGSDHEGIMALDPDTALGLDVVEALDLDDVVLDLDITPNRPDAMCVVGVARELAAHFRTPFEVSEPSVDFDAAVTNPATVVIEAPDRCPRYLAGVARVTLGPSPAWMAQRLVKAGMRPINNVVDVTNYVLLERNQPLHAFDLERLAGPGIVVRLAQAGETITTLDDVERELTEEDLLICDAERVPQALAGIMGGTSSGIGDDTTSILLEAAFFEPMGVARSSKRLKLRSESSARFERGIDPDAVATNAMRALELLAEVAGARVSSTIVDEYVTPAASSSVAVRPARVNAVLGTDLSDEDVVASLAPLGVATTAVDGDGDARSFGARIPSWRPDLTREIDLVEEVARRVGFEHIGRTVPDTAGQIGALSARQRDRRRVADALVGAGLSEAITLSLVSPADLERGGAPIERVVTATNPLRAEESVLRTAILAGLLRALAGNRAHGLGDVALFEMGRVFFEPQDGAGPLPEEPEHLAFALGGIVRRRPVEDDRPVDLHDAADLVHVVADALELADVAIRPDDRKGFTPGRAAEVLVDGGVVGAFGELSPDVVDAMALESPIVAAELALEPLFDATRRDRRFRMPSRYPASGIDLAFVVDAGVTADDVLAVLRESGGAVLESAHCFDEFRSDDLGDRRSLAFALRYRASDRTLTDEAVGALRSAAIDAVTSRLPATLRT